MKVGKRQLQVVFRHVKKDEKQDIINQAFDLLFEEVYRIMNEKPIVATK